ncbi:MAG: Ldh family oxidoreductase [Rhodospirillales bacterium]|nr:Ldh family oxidoreductase [Rhodospirillales bacterium]
MVDVHLTLDDVHALATSCLMTNGCDAGNAGAVANTITAAERDGAASHGLFRLPGYVATLKSGKVNGAAQPSIKNLAPGVLQMNGDGGFAPYAHQQSRNAFIKCARSQGIAALAIINTHHFSALWAEVEPLAAEGLCAFAFTAFKPAIAPAGGRKPLFGTNPMAFGWPRPGGNPVVFDQASAAMARGEVMIAARDGHELPPGVGVDSDGNPTTNPDAILKGALLPFGGHKGSCIAMMVELLVAGLIGEAFSFEAAARDNNDGGPPQGGELMIAMDPARFGDAEGWAEHAEALFGEMAAQSGVRLPADRRYANRQKSLSDGITIPESLHATIMAL